MVLGAGLGTRLRPFTDATPKPLLPVHGVPCIEFALISLKEAGVSDVVVNVHAHAEQMRAYMASLKIPGLLLHESDETEQLLGSAGGFKKALPLLGGSSFFSMNADVIHLTSLQALRKRHEALRREHGVVMTLVLASGECVQEQAGEYREIFTDEASGLIHGFGEKKNRVPFYTGTAIIEAEAFSGLREGSPAEFVPEVLEPAIRAGKVGFLFSDSLWIDIGSPELWHKAQFKLAESMRAGTLPQVFQDRLLQADPTFGGRFELGKNKIQLDDIEYEIKDIRRS